MVIRYDVAPHVGAWIETALQWLRQWQHSSLPMWERGLKQDLSMHYRSLTDVAPHVGAWIETVVCRQFNSLYMSLPMWERGLKLVLHPTLIRLQMSLPMWERGLKHQIRLKNRAIRRRSPCGSVDWNVAGLPSWLLNAVAPHVGAWIETCETNIIDVDDVVAPHVGAWIEI